jgi:hypothetical protein
VIKRAEAAAIESVPMISTSASKALRIMSVCA